MIKRKVQIYKFVSLCSFFLCSCSSHSSTDKQSSTNIGETAAVRSTVDQQLDTKPKRSQIGTADKRNIVVVREAANKRSTADIEGIASVIDGDTLKIQETRFRLHGIDTPESKQTCIAKGSTYPCGKHATFALSNKIKGSPIRCSVKDKDRYGRFVAVCFQNGEDLNAWMVSQGWAVAYRRYSEDYVSQEQAAKSAGVGIWAGAFVMPWDWRRGKRLNQMEPSNKSDGCKIKGNISSRGQKIYHIPGGYWYERTQIDTAKGEKYFCSEKEATAEGWRKSPR